MVVRVFRACCPNRVEVNSVAVVGVLILDRPVEEQWQRRVEAGSGGGEAMACWSAGRKLGVKNEELRLVMRDATNVMRNS
jgi:hypothetical protein